MGALALLASIARLHIVAIGRQMTHILNGHIISVLVDEDWLFSTPPGLLHSNGFVLVRLTSIE